MVGDLFEMSSFESWNVMCLDGSLGGLGAFDSAWSARDF